MQFGKHAFMVYNVCAKMTIFKNLGHTDSGVEIVPTKKFAQRMSSGVSYFEQIVWDLDHKGSGSQLTQFLNYPHESFSPITSCQKNF